MKNNNIFTHKFYYIEKQNTTMSENVKDNLENAIGHIGGVEQEGQSLGHLQHKIGQQESLDEEQQLGMNEFLANARSQSKITRNDDTYDEDNVPRVIDIMNGWIPVDKRELGQRAAFYPASYEFRVRPASVDDIKKWSQIDADPKKVQIHVLNRVFNEVLKSCVAIYDAGVKVSGMKINFWDRLWFILKVREVTFATKRMPNISVKNCPECDGTLNIDLNPSVLTFSFPDDDVMKYFNAATRTWTIDPQEFGIAGNVINFYLPTPEKGQLIFDWALNQSRENKTIDETFLKYLPWMLPRVGKNEDFVEKMITECKRVYKSWDTPELFSFIEQVLRNIDVEPLEKIMMTCPTCGEEVMLDVEFPKGIRPLFIAETNVKFGSK